MLCNSEISETAGFIQVDQQWKNTTLEKDCKSPAQEERDGLQANAPSSAAVCSGCKSSLGATQPAAYENNVFEHSLAETLPPDTRNTNDRGDLVQQVVEQSQMAEVDMVPDGQADDHCRETENTWGSAELDYNGQEDYLPETQPSIECMYSCNERSAVVGDKIAVLVNNKDMVVKANASTSLESLSNWQPLATSTPTREGIICLRVVADQQANNGHCSYYSSSDERNQDETHAFSQHSNMVEDSLEETLPPEGYRSNDLTAAEQLTGEVQMRSAEDMRFKVHLAHERSSLVNKSDAKGHDGHGVQNHNQEHFKLVAKAPRGHSLTECSQPLELRSNIANSVDGMELKDWKPCYQTTKKGWLSQETIRDSQHCSAAEEWVAETQIPQGMTNVESGTNKKRSYVNVSSVVPDSIIETEVVENCRWPWLNGYTTEKDQQEVTSWESWVPETQFIDNQPIDHSRRQRAKNDFKNEFVPNNVVEDTLTDTATVINVRNNNTISKKTSLCDRLKKKAAQRCRSLKWVRNSWKDNFQTVTGCYPTGKNTEGKAGSLKKPSSAVVSSTNHEEEATKRYSEWLQCTSKDVGKSNILLQQPERFPEPTHTSLCQQAGPLPKEAKRTISSFKHKIAESSEQHNGVTKEQMNQLLKKFKPTYTEWKNRNQSTTAELKRRKLQEAAERRRKAREAKDRREQKRQEAEKKRADMLIAKSKLAPITLADEFFKDYEPPDDFFDKVREQSRKERMGARRKTAQQRRQMVGHDCPCCRPYYDALNLSPESRAKRVNESSRHRSETVRPPTPEWVWNPLISSSDDEM